MTGDRSLADVESYNPEILPGAFDVPANWQKIFGRKAPLVVEIGCGGGRYIIGQAEAHPEIDYFAVERAGEFFNILKERVAKRRLANMRVCHTDAGDLVANVFPDKGVNTYHIYFPDPWPKKKHHKRRIFSKEVCGHLLRTLEPGGMLYFATDHHDYLQDVLPNIREVLPLKEHPAPWEDAPEGRTNYEIKYMKQGRPIWRFTAQKPR